jgi:hypothetical protein
MGSNPAPIKAKIGPVATTTTACTVTDYATTLNLTSFGLCMSLANPQVAAATTAAQGVLTPQPCMPMVVGSWIPGSLTAKTNGMPLLTEAATCTCAWLGAITVVAPMQQTAQTL